MWQTVVSFREPVTISRAADILSAQGVTVTPKALRRLIDRRKIKAKACLVTDPRHPLLFDLWEIEAALAARNTRRVEGQRRRHLGVR